jgi:hydrogenase/urease accessory protein HupE
MTATPKAVTPKTVTEVAHLLRTHAAGLLAQTAAVDLLIAHRYWLTRAGFTARFVHPVTTDDGRHIGAWID